MKALLSMMVASVLPATMFSTEINSKKTENELPRPNILWLTFEDTSPQFIGCYGDSMAKTPTMDKLASEGVRFTSAYSTGTVSSPSRFCLITGMTPTTMGTGNHRSQYPIPEFVHGFPKYLKDAGYYTSNNYKTDYNNAREKEIIEESWNESSGKAGWWKRKPGQPFFAVFNSPHSHQSRTMTNPWQVYEKQVLSHLDSVRMTPVDAGFDMPDFYRDSPEMRRQMSRVYNSISLTDQQFEGILKRLEKDGLKDSTIVFCFSDHGEGIPRGKGSSLGLGYRVPFIVWIPEMYKHLSPWGSGVVTDRLVSFEDFGATVLSLAGVEIPEYIEGKPFMGENCAKEKEYVYGACDALGGNNELSRSVTDGRYMYTRVFTCHQPWVRWMDYYDKGDIQKIMRNDFDKGLMNEDQEAIMVSRQCEYLYDLHDDKWEMVNLADNPRYAKTLEKFRNKMLNHILETRDAHFIPEYSYSQYSDQYIPYTLRQNESIYPVEKVLETAMLCGMGKFVIPEQISLLDSGNDIVEYWAALGLFISRYNLDEYLSKLRDLIITMDYIPAKLYLAGALYDCNRDEFAKQILSDGLLSENIEINKISIQILLNLKIENVLSLKEIAEKHYLLYSDKKSHSNVEFFLNVLLLRLGSVYYKA